MVHLLHRLTADQFRASSSELEGASIGGHYRHIIEIFLCLLENYKTGTINYDQRRRSQKMETDPAFALQKINYIMANLERENKSIFLEQTLDGEKLLLESNYYRELLYNLEHAIHHQALIKIGISQLGNIEISKDFGVAHSTLAYRKLCVQ